MRHRYHLPNVSHVGVADHPNLLFPSLTLPLLFFPFPFLSPFLFCLYISSLCSSWVPLIADYIFEEMAECVSMNRYTFSQRNAHTSYSSKRYHCLTQSYVEASSKGKLRQFSPAFYHLQERCVLSPHSWNSLCTFRSCMPDEGERWTYIPVDSGPQQSTLFYTLEQNTWLWCG